MRFRAFATALALSLSLLAPAVPAADTPPDPALARACVSLETSAPARTRCATALKTALLAEPSAAGVLKGAAKSGKTRSTEELLKRIGLPADVLNAADIVVDEEGTGNARIKDISVEISCCPLKITIIIRL